MSVLNRRSGAWKRKERERVREHERKKNNSPSFVGSFFLSLAAYSICAPLGHREQNPLAAWNCQGGSWVTGHRCRGPGAIGAAGTIRGHLFSFDDMLQRRFMADRALPCQPASHQNPTTLHRRPKRNKREREKPKKITKNQFDTLLLLFLLLLLRPSRKKNRKRWWKWKQGNETISLKKCLKNGFNLMLKCECPDNASKNQTPFSFHRSQSLSLAFETRFNLQITPNFGQINSPPLQFFEINHNTINRIDSIAVKIEPRKSNMETELELELGNGIQWRPYNHTSNNCSPLTLLWKANGTHPWKQERGEAQKPDPKSSRNDQSVWMIPSRNAIEFRRRNRNDLRREYSWNTIGVGVETCQGRLMKRFRVESTLTHTAHTYVNAFRVGNINGIAKIHIWSKPLAREGALRP